ncbi:hypothetical protein DFH06DRAFT_1267914 [Mycena polygramma]|nr:hypothetical protein DFH06DRAFT_1267914 [Mycena polygramma]
MVVNWADPAEILKDSDAFAKIIFVLFGVQIWELFTTFSFECSLVTGRRRFRWPLVLNIFGDSDLIWTHSLPLFPSILLSLSWTGNMSILCASTSLMLRTIALWERKRSVVAPLVLLSCAHWILLYRTMFVVRAVWDDELSMCVVASTNPSLLNVTFFFSTDFRLMARHSARTDLWKLLFTDGLVYFVVTFSMNCIPASWHALGSLHLKYLDSPHERTYAKPRSSIAACRAVMRLLDYNSEVYIHSMAAVLPSSDPRHSNMLPFSLPSVPRFTLARPDGVLVTTEHITMSEFP